MEILNVSHGLVGSKTNSEKGYIYTIGNFDGLHRGHMSVLNKLVEVSNESGNKSAVVTFENHPFSKHENFKVLSCNSEKLECFEKMGIDRVIFFEFEQIKDMGHEEFIELLKDRFSLSALVLGQGSHLGKSKSGDIQKFSQITKIYVVEHLLSLEGKISSTLIRDYVQKGEIEKANNLLGRHYSISGRRVLGKKIASTIGFPTVNVSPCQHNKMVPARGVYAVEFVHSGKSFLAACNVGVKPTFANESEQLITIEVHVIDSNGLDIGEGQDVRVAFMRKIRDETKFDKKEDLAEQIKKDIKNIKEKYGGKRNESYQGRETAGYKRVRC